MPKHRRLPGRSDFAFKGPALPLGYHLQERKRLTTPGQGCRGWVAMGSVSCGAGRLEEKWEIEILLGVV